jgi:hypothetical protein
MKCVHLLVRLLVTCMSVAVLMGGYAWTQIPPPPPKLCQDMQPSPYGDPGPACTPLDANFSTAVPLIAVYRRVLPSKVLNAGKRTGCERLFSVFAAVYSDFVDVPGRIKLPPSVPLPVSRIRAFHTWREAIWASTSTGAV